MRIARPEVKRFFRHRLKSRGVEAFYYKLCVIVSQQFNYYFAHDENNADQFYFKFEQFNSLLCTSLASLTIFTLFSHLRIQHNQNNSGAACRSRCPDGGAPSPTPSDTSDSDISLGTHSPIPNNLQLQHSPGSTSNGANDREETLSVDDDKPRDLTSTLANSLTSASLAYATAAAPPSLAPNCLAPLKFDTTANRLFSGCYLQNFSNLKEMTQFPIQPIVIRPHPQLPPSTYASLNGQSHIHAANYNPTFPECTVPPKIRVSSPEKLNAINLSPASLQDTATYHHSAQLLHRPFSTSPDLAHNATDIT